MTAALVSFLEDLTSAVSSQSESLDGLGAGPDQPAPPVCRVALGFDYGRTRIGVAAGEAVTGSARPLRTLPARQQHPDWDAIGRLIKDWHPDLLVVGVPRHADGSASAQLRVD